jgi:hypothetical protein
VNPVFRFWLRTSFYGWYLTFIALLVVTANRWVQWKLGMVPYIIYPGREFSLWYWHLVTALLLGALLTAIRWFQGRIPDEDRKSWFSRPSGL